MRQVARDGAPLARAVGNRGFCLAFFFGGLGVGVEVDASLGAIGESIGARV